MLELRTLPLNTKFYVETRFGPDDITDLKNDIAEKGMIEPINCLRVPFGYIVLNGRRRIRVAQELGKRDIKAYVYSDIAPDVLHKLITFIDD